MSTEDDDNKSSNTKDEGDDNMLAVKNNTVYIKPSKEEVLKKLEKIERNYKNTFRNLAK